MLCEYQRRDGLVAALLQDRDELRREVGRSTAQAAKAERQRDDALRALDRTKVRSSCRGVKSTPVGTHILQQSYCALELMPVVF